MNKITRKRLEDAQDKLTQARELLEEARDIVEEIAEEEHDKFANASEGLQNTERFMTIEENADTMDYFVQDLEDIISSIEDAECNETFEM